MRATGCEARHAVNNINGQTEAVDLIPNGQFQWRINVALLAVPMNVKGSRGWLGDRRACESALDSRES